jgi:hypothetical protein
VARAVLYPPGMKTIETELLATVVGGESLG